MSYIGTAITIFRFMFSAKRFRDLLEASLFIILQNEIIKYVLNPDHKKRSAEVLPEECAGGTFVYTHFPHVMDIPLKRRCYKEWKILYSNR